MFAYLLSETIEQMLEAELTEKLSYARYEAEGRNSDNNWNRYYTSKTRTSSGSAEIKVRVIKMNSSYFVCHWFLTRNVIG